jgi:2-hydroxyacyl-CoA lyase 1
VNGLAGLANAAIVGQLNKALAGRQWFHPKDTPWRQMITKKASENAAMIRPQIHDDEAPANYYRALRDVAAWMPKNAFLSAEGAGTMDIGLSQLPSFNARSCLNAGTYGTMGVGLGQAIAACVVHPDRPVIHLSGDSAIGFSGMEMETLVRYNFPCKIVVLNNGGIGPGMPEIPENPMFKMKPNSLIYGARYDRMMEAPGLRRGRPQRQGLLRREPEGHPRRPRRGDEPPRPRPRQRRPLAGLRPEAASVPLAQLTG